MGLTVVDTGILIGVLNAADPHHEASVSALRTRIDGGDKLLVPASVYAELLVEPFQRGDDAVEVVDAFLASLGVQVREISAGVARVAARLRAEYGRGLRLPDALVVATAEVVRADRVLTTDRRWPSGHPVEVEVVGVSP